jgi:hypothetical protein
MRKHDVIMNYSTFIYNIPKLHLANFTHHLVCYRLLQIFNEQVMGSPLDKAAEALIGRIPKFSGKLLPTANGEGEKEEVGSPQGGVRKNHSSLSSSISASLNMVFLNTTMNS